MFATEFVSMKTKRKVRKLCRTEFQQICAYIYIVDVCFALCVQLNTCVGLYVVKASVQVCGIKEKGK